MKRLQLVIIIIFVLTACIQHRSGTEVPKSTEEAYSPKEYVELHHPEWTKNSTIYEVNVRQYTPEGTFKAFEKHLGRLKAMGVDILWLMPMHPIGGQNRKGTLGSEYSVKDYLAINPEFGTREDFRHLVDTIHAMGMHLIIDWVANHSAWDNALVTQHPDWYIKNREGNFQSTPWRDYDDIIDFNYDQPGLRKYMIDAMKYWVKETNIDGFRCDVASFVPIDFWENARAELDKIKPVFMLAEAADRDLHKKAFDATYSWALWDVLHNITTKHAPVDALAGGYIAEHVSTWPRDGYRMNFVDNHDKNAWEGTQFTNFGKGLFASIVLTGTMEGIPMMYSGQEAGLDHSLKFFDKDIIQWKEDTIGAIYSRLFHLKHENSALWNGKWGGEMVRIKNDKMQQVISFIREKDKDKVITIVNLSDHSVQTVLDTRYDTGTYKDVFTGKPFTIKEDDSLNLAPWQFIVLVQQD